MTRSGMTSLLESWLWRSELVALLHRLVDLRVQGYLPALVEVQRLLTEAWTAVDDLTTAFTAKAFAQDVQLNVDAPALLPAIPNFALVP